METSMSLELELLAELRGALTDHEIGAEVREDVAGLAVATGVPGAKVRVFVSFTGRYFSWNRGNHQHPVNDIASAARRIAVHLQGLHLLLPGNPGGISGTPPCGRFSCVPHPPEHTGR